MWVTYWCSLVCLIVPVIGLYKYGVVLPNDPYVFIKHQLTMQCNITEPVPETSDALFFTKSNKTISQEYIQILSTRSIQLKKPILSVEDQGNYVCKLKRTGSPYPIVIGNQFVIVEYFPKKVETISCEVYNWENMTCSWDLGVNYVHTKHIDVQLAFTVSDDSSQWDCPHLTPTTCSWKKIDGRNSFRPNMKYYMVVEVKNRRTQNLTTSRMFRIESSTIVRPSSVTDLQTSNNSTCISLRWAHSKLNIYGMTFRVQYKSDWEKNRWKEILLDNETTATICNLVPSTAYTVKVSCKPTLAGHWSEEQGTTVTMDQDVPGAAPEIKPGGFVEKYCQFDGCRTINVYWRPIIDRLANGKIINYRLTAHGTGTLKAGDTGTMSPPPDDTGINTSGKLTLLADQDYIVDVKGQTEAGLSHHKHGILILAKDKKPPYPSNFVVTAKENPAYPHTYDLYMTWSEPETTQEIVGYTLFWCNGTSDDLDCLEPMVWVGINRDQKEFKKTVNQIEMRGLIFGISMETKYSRENNVSSGILWNECIYMHSEKPLLPPKNVRVLSLVEDNSLLVEWDKYKCSETRRYINEYNVYYCEAMGGQNCTGNFNVVHVPRHQTRKVLVEISPEITYRVWVQASSPNGLGPESDAVFATIPDRGTPLTSEELTIIVVGCSLLLLISIIGLIIIFRRCAVEVKETFKPYDIDMPNVPLPPIPMLRPRPSIPKTPESEDDEIYSKIPELPSPTPSDYVFQPDAPLISNTEKLYDRIGRMFKPTENSGTGGGQGSSPSLLSRLHLCRNSMDSRGSNYQDNKYLGTFGSRPKRPCTSGISSSVDMISSDVSPYSCVDIVCPNSEKIPRKHTCISTEKPCHSAGSMIDDPDYISNRPNNLSVLSDKNQTCTSTTESDSREHFNIQLSLDRRKPHFHNDTITSCASNEIYSDSGQTRDSNGEQMNDSNSGQTCDSNNGQTHGSDSGQTHKSNCGQTHESNSGQTHESSSNLTQDSNYLYEDKISSYVQETEMGAQNNPVFSPPQSADGYIQETQLKCPNNNDIKMVNGYIPTQNISEVLPNPNDISDKREVTYRKKLNIRPGPRPISEVVQVPPHFYGSLSLLDSGDATEL